MALCALKDTHIHAYPRFLYFFVDHHKLLVSDPFLAAFFLIQSIQYFLSLLDLDDLYDYDVLVVTMALNILHRREAVRASNKKICYIRNKVF